MVQEKSTRGFVQISVEEYDELRKSVRMLNEILASDKAIEISSYYSYDSGYPTYIINPAPDFIALSKKLCEEQKIKMDRYWRLRGLDKKVSIFDIGKKIGEIVDK